MAIRSGRFDRALAGTPAKIVIIKSERSTAFYRVFNSGDVTFDVNNGSSTTHLAPTFSLDITVKGEAKIQGNDGDQVKGIYEYLDSQIVGQPIRSGRFKIAAASNAAHKIIDLAHQGGSENAYYRIFNSDEDTFQVWEGNPGDTSSKKLCDLEKEQSYDFEIKSKKDIWVQKATANTRIEGIYDFLGVR